VADSKRKQVMDGIVAACSTIDGVTSATRTYENWWQLEAHRFPRVFVRDVEATLTPLCFRSTSAADMQAELTVECVAFVHDKFNANVADKRSAIISDIEKTVVSSSHVTAQVLSIWPETITTDEEYLDNYGIAKLRFKATYEYNHLSP
jgi:hypothetical protein